MSSQPLPLPVTGDFELASRALVGDLDAYAVLVRRYHGRLFQTLYALVGDWDDADDLAQDVFIKAYRSLHQFRGHSQFYTWIYRIGVNQALDWMKARDRRRDAPLEYAESDPQGRVEDTDGLAFRRELQAHLESALDRLAPEFRAAVVLREIEGRPYGEIARLLNCSVGTVKSRLFRARNQLRVFLEAVYNEVRAPGSPDGKAPCLR